MLAYSPSYDPPMALAAHDDAGGLVGYVSWNGPNSLYFGVGPVGLTLDFEDVYSEAEEYAAIILRCCLRYDRLPGGYSYSLVPFLFSESDRDRID